jgi:hypothetical protein
MNLFRFGANLRLIPETSKLFLYFRILEDKTNRPVWLKLPNTP